MPSRVRQRSGGEVAHHHLERDDLDHPHQLLAHVQAADEMRGHADGVQPGHEEFRQPVVQHALAFDRLPGARHADRAAIVLEVLDQRSRLGAFVEDLRLAFVDLLATCHEFSGHRSDVAADRPGRRLHVVGRAIRQAGPCRKATSAPAPLAGRGDETAYERTSAITQGSTHVDLRRPRTGLRIQVRP